MECRLCNACKAVDAMFLKDPGWAKENNANGEAATIGDLQSPWLGGLSTTPLSTFLFEKSMAAKVVSMVENNIYGLEY